MSFALHGIVPVCMVIRVCTVENKIIIMILCMVSPRFPSFLVKRTKPESKADPIFCIYQGSYDWITASNLKSRGNVINSSIESKILLHLP